MLTVADAMLILMLTAVYADADTLILLILCSPLMLMPCHAAADATPRRGCRAMLARRHAIHAFSRRCRHA